MSLVDLDAVTACLALRDDDGTRVLADNLRYPGGRVFGGQILGQLIALAATHPDKELGSLHVVFSREGDLDMPLRYERRVVRDGRAMATWAVEVAQDGSCLATALLSLRSRGGDLVHRPVNPRAAAPPPAPVVRPELVPWEVRSDIDLADTDVGPARYDWAMRVAGLQAPPWVHHALVAYATDLNFVPTALRPFEGVGSGDAHVTFATAVTSHTMWFHRDVDLSDWVRCEQEVTSVEGSYAYGHGGAWDAEGHLVASYAQECLLRPKAPDRSR